jgi:hypothetical protein
MLGSWLCFVGTLLMIPESVRLTTKNKEGSISFSTRMPAARLAPYLQTIGLILLCAGLLLVAIDNSK